MLGGQIGGSGHARHLLQRRRPAGRYRGNLFFCDWGLQNVSRYVVEKAGGTFKLKSKEPFVTQGDYPEFRPFSLAVSPDGASLYLVDWGFSIWLAKGPQTGRLYRLTIRRARQVTPAPRPTGTDSRLSSRAGSPCTFGPSRVAASDRCDRQPRGGASRARLKAAEPTPGRLHALGPSMRSGPRKPAPRSVRDSVTVTPRCVFRPLGARAFVVIAQRGRHSKHGCATPIPRCAERRRSRSAGSATPPRRSP